MKNLSGTYFITIFILFIIINPSSVYSYKTFSYNETEPGYQVYQVLTYLDGTSVVYLTKPINDTCNEPRINLRIIHPNGTVDKTGVNYPIPDFNFCLIPEDISLSLHIVLFRHIPDSIFVLYENSTDINSASYYALLVTRTGKIVSNTFLSRVSVINGTLYSYGFIVPHVNEEYGFLFINYLTETTLQWIYFSPDSNNNFRLINHGQTEHATDIFSAIDGTFGIVTRKYTKISSKSRDGLIKLNPTEPKFELYITFIKPDAVDGPFLLYQTAIPNLQVQSLCNTAYLTLGYYCILNIKNEQPNKKYKYHSLKIEFRNTGSVIGIEKFSDFELYKDLGETTVFDSLYYGGFFVIIFNDSENTIPRTFQTIILDNSGNYHSTLDLPKIKITNRLATGVFRNNTFIVVYKEDDYAWKIYSADIPRFTYNDNGYDNPNIKTTYPLINSKIPLLTTNINITYNFPITISTNNISIYQDDNSGDPKLRQSIPGNSPSFTDSADNQTINLNVLESTFNQPNAKYYIVISDNAVKDLETNQPLIGITNDIWKFDTVDNRDIFAEDAIGRFYLTTEGTKYFESLPSSNKTEYLSRLRIDLAKSIPVDINRLGAIGCCKYDKSQQYPKILLSLLIKSTTNLNERNVDRIIKDLDILIKNKEVTPISWFGTTNLIDAKFGFQLTRNFFSDFKFHLIGIAIGIIVLGLLYFYVRKKHPTGENIVIFKISIIILDFVLDILFILNNGTNVPQLLIPSIIFCAIPMAINCVLSMIIILREIKQNKVFYEWFKNNTNIASIFTILASADIGVLNILSSKVAGIMIFYAPISKETRSYIFLGSLLGFFIEDIPQFIIQILYKSWTVTYDIIPFLALSTSSIILALNIVSRIYHLYNLCVQSHKKKRISEIILPINQKTFI